MANYRRGRINDEVTKEVAQILREVKDPRVRDAFVSVTGAEVTPDLKYAKIYYSFLNGDEKELRRGLKAASVFIRGGLAKRMNLRITPELTFVRDTSLEYGAHINKLLSKVEDELAEIDAREAAAVELNPQDDEEE
ncbi:MAG: 30S ribosome-binding factor RbfA [Clostridia bacterium]|nr:30S ribosome-binding factor RbfA [Clostridia bacterium]